MELSHNYMHYGLDSSKCWTICIMQLFRLGVLNHGEFSQFFHPRYLETDPVTAREIQVVSIVNQILSDTPYFLSLAKREGVSFVVPEEIASPLLSEEDALELVRNDPADIRLILDPSPAVQLEAISLDISVLKFIKTPCFEVLMKVNGIP